MTIEVREQTTWYKRADLTLGQVAELTDKELSDLVDTFGGGMAVTVDYDMVRQDPAVFRVRDHGDGKDTPGVSLTFARDVARKALESTEDAYVPFEKDWPFITLFDYYMASALYGGKYGYGIVEERLGKDKADRLTLEHILIPLKGMLGK